MAKIMQVIEKKTNPSNGTVALKLYQTGFKTLTKLVGTKVGQTIANVVGGQELGYQMLQDNVDGQMSVKTQLDKFTASYNSSINSKKSKVTGLFSFAYSFNSLYNYKEELYEGMKADYNLLQKFVNAEKEMYDFTVYSKQHIQRNCEVMGEWSKTQKYGSCVKAMMTQEAEAQSRIFNITISHNGGEYGVTHKRASTGSDKYMAEIIGLNNLPLNYQFKFTMNGWIAGADDDEPLSITYSITRKPLGTTSDDGYYDVFSYSYYGLHRVNGTSYVTQWTGLPSPYFADSSGIYDYKFFNSRKLI